MVVLPNELCSAVIWSSSGTGSILLNDKLADRRRRAEPQSHTLRLSTVRFAGAAGYRTGRNG